MVTDAEQRRRWLRETYDEFAPRYDRMEAPIEWLLVARLRARSLARARGRVLEVAIGTGRNLAHYPAAVTHLTGVDLSPGMLAEARVKAEGAGFPIELGEADAHRLPFDDDSFDTVATTLSSCTFSDPAGAMREMARVCRPDGSILLLEHGRSDRSLLARLQDRTADWHARMLGCRWNREPQELAREAGLEIVDATRKLLGVFHLIEARPR